VKKGNLLPFVCGEILSTVYFLFSNDINHFLIRIASTVIVGLCGGVAGLAGKDIYKALLPVARRLYKKLIQTLKRK
jgi:hypothetical protein